MGSVGRPSARGLSLQQTDFMKVMAAGQLTQIPASGRLGGASFAPADVTRADTWSVPLSVLHGFVMPHRRPMLNDSPDAPRVESALPDGPSEGKSALEELDHPSFGLVADDRSGQVYNQEAFRYFLDIERKRSESSERPFLLLLIDLKKQAAADAHLDAEVAAKLFAALAPALRETDFVGWYHEGRVAGAVLTQHAGPGVTDVPEVISQRIAKALGQHLPSAVARRLQVRVFLIPTNARERV
jgi:hypothetical protein